MTQREKNKPFYLAVVDGKVGYYDAYIVNTTNKEYFLRTRYEEKILKPYSAFLYGEVVKDRDHETISPWVCDDVSETYLLYFSNLPYYCQSKTYDEYLKKDVYQLECKIENIFHKVQSVKIRNKAKELELDSLSGFVNKQMKKIEPEINGLLVALDKYLTIYQAYHDFGKLRVLLSSLQTLSIIEEFLQILDFDIVLSIKKSIKEKEFLHRLKITQKKNFVDYFLQNNLRFLDLEQKDKKQMLLDIQIYDEYNQIFLTYLKNNHFVLEESDEERLDRYNCSKHYKMTKDGQSIEFDSIYCLIDDGVVYYFTLEPLVFQKVLLDFVQNNSKSMFDIKYLKDREISSFEETYDYHKNSWY